MIMIPMPIENQPVIHDPLASAAEQLVATVKLYMGEMEVESVKQAIRLAQETCGGIHEHREASLQSLQQISPLEHALAVGSILAQMRIDAV